MKKINKLITVLIKTLLLVMLPFSLCGCNKEISEAVSSVTISGTVKEDEIPGRIVTDISYEMMHDAGFDYGDLCRVTFGNGYVIEDIPLYSGYYGKTGENIIVNYQGSDYVKIVACQSSAIWEEVGCKDGDTVEISLTEKGGSLYVEEALKMTYSLNRDDYKDDETFSNFRVLSGGKLNDKLFYRGASAIYDAYGRVSYTNELLKKYGISYIVDFNTSEELLEAYLDEYDSSDSLYMEMYEKGNVLLTKIGNDYSSKSTAEIIANAFREIMKHEGPYYINCAEGKDRTGYVCILIEILGDYSLDEIRDDYMTTYFNYYGIEEDDTSKYNAIVEYKFNDIMFNLTDTETIEELEKTDLKETVRNYLLNGQMSEEEIQCFEELIHK